MPTELSTHARRQLEERGDLEAELLLALALVWERSGECPGAVPVLVCHDEVVVECDVEQAGDVKAWLEKAMFEGMEAVLNSTDEVHVPVEVEGRIASSWAEGG